MTRLTFFGASYIKEARGGQVFVGLPCGRAALIEKPTEASIARGSCLVTFAGSGAVIDVAVIIASDC